MNQQIRPYQPGDFDAVNILWRLAREVSLPDFQQRKGHPFYKDLAYFRDHILQHNQVWVAVDQHDYPLAFMAIKDDFIDQLYVHPEKWGQGLGTQLLAHARQLSPRYLWLYTLQINEKARRFYEQQGFRIAELGISPPPESEPDVKYVWYPD